MNTIDLTRSPAGQSHFHESAAAQVSGKAQYIDDLPEVKGTLFAAPIFSPVAHGNLRGMDTSKAAAMPGVKGFVTAEDIPGDPLLAAFGHDEHPWLVKSSMTALAPCLRSPAAAGEAMASEAAMMAKNRRTFMPTF